MIDSHCHLDFSAFDNDREQVIQHCIRLGITKIIVPGTKPDAWNKQIALSEECDLLEFALGVHPVFAELQGFQYLDKLHALVAQHRSKVVAIGEIGLDYFVDTQDNYDAQRQWFDQQLQLALKYRLPVIIHHRRSHNHLIKMLKDAKFDTGGVVHAFSGSYEVAKTYLDLGFTLGFGGVITYERARKTRDVLKRIPLEAICLETDAPDMPLYGKQGLRNSPEFIPEIADHIARLKGVALSEVISVTTHNVRQLFALT